MGKCMYEWVSKLIGECVCVLLNEHISECISE